MLNAPDVRNLPFEMLLVIVLISCTMNVVAPSAIVHVQECGSESEVYQKCEKREEREVICELTCDNFRLPKKPMCACEAKCVCKHQFVRNVVSNKCVYRFQCPGTWWPWTGYH